jgi:hypothetical protein
MTQNCLMIHTTLYNSLPCLGIEKRGLLYIERTTSPRSKILKNQKNDRTDRLFDEMYHTYFTSYENRKHRLCDTLSFVNV